MSGSREQVLHYSGPLLHKKTQLVAQPAATSGLCPASEDKRGHGPPAPAHLLSHWSKSGPEGPDSSVPAGVLRAFQTFPGEATGHTLHHSTAFVPRSDRRNQPQGLHRRGGEGCLLELPCLHPAVTWGSFQMPALTLGGRRRTRAPALLDDGQGPWCGGGGKGWDALINKEPRAQDAVKARET